MYNTYYSGYKSGYMIIICSESAGKNFMTACDGDLECARLHAMEQLNILQFPECLIVYHQNHKGFYEYFEGMESVEFGEIPPDSLKRMMQTCIANATAFNVVKDAHHV